MIQRRAIALRRFGERAEDVAKMRELRIVENRQVDGRTANIQRIAHRRTERFCAFPHERQQHHEQERHKHRTIAA